MKKRWYILVFGLLLTAVFCAGVWQSIRPRDRYFRGQPESYWVEHLVYRDDEQVKQWREFGPDGVQVLIRALEGANRPKDRIYRRVYRGMIRVLPAHWGSALPAPKQDATRTTRMKVVDVLSRLSKNAMPAIPIMTRELHDEDAGVRQITINFFTEGEDENCLLNKMDPKAKKALLSDFIQAARDANDGVRNNAMVALRFYPEQAQVVVPVLLIALQDPAPMVRRVAAIALKKIDPATAAKAGVN